MTYDQWKCTDPNDTGYDDREDNCNHEEFSIDWEGRASCDYCLAHWWASTDEIEAQRQHEQEYAEWQERQHRIEFLKRWFLDPTFALRWRLQDWLSRHWPWRKPKVISDHDDIPF